MTHGARVLGALVTAALLLASCDGSPGEGFAPDGRSGGSDASDLSGAPSDDTSGPPRGSGPPDRCKAAICNAPLDRRVEFSDPTERR